MGIKAGISYEVLRALALQQGHVVLVSCEDLPDANLAAILRRIGFRVSMKGHEVRRASKTSIRIFVFGFMFLLLYTERYSANTRSRHIPL